MSTSLNRRQFVELGLLSSAQLFALGCRKVAHSPVHSEPSSPAAIDLGPLLTDPQQVIDLPDGFSYVVLQTAGDLMSDGHRMPPQPDGMTAVMDEDGHYVLLRNHELSDAQWLQRHELPTGFFHSEIPPQGSYNPEMYGGVSRLIVGIEKLDQALLGHAPATDCVERSHMVLTGTKFNCSGGAVPHGWISCEETDTVGHGYAFFTRTDDETLVDPHSRRITSWGRFCREGIALDTSTGVVYMSEDHGQGCFYRYVPADATQPMGPGTLQALAIPEVEDTDPEDGLIDGTSWSVTWLNIDDPQAHEEPCRTQGKRLGASRFNRCEGIVWDGTFVWFVASQGGPQSAGQLYRYEPSSQTLTLAVQVTDRSALSMPDNLAVTPWGDLLLAEDNYNNGGGATHQHMRGLTRDGRIYDIARNPKNTPEWSGAEFTGACFSPDGQVLFVNMQSPQNLTIAIRGPWPTR